LCLTDVFATCAELLQKPLPTQAAPDSYSFLGTLLNRRDFSPRPGIVHHSVHGEFAYREGPWKLVFQMPTDKRATSRGKEALVRLYDLEGDVAETKDVSDNHPQLVSQMTTALDSIVNNGRSTFGPRLENDVLVDFRRIQPRRWMANQNAQ
jgi:hypothetical protein